MVVTVFKQRVSQMLVFPWIIFSHENAILHANYWRQSCKHVLLWACNNFKLLKVAIRGRLHWHQMALSDVIWNIFDASDWLTEKKEGMSSNGKHQKCFKWHPMAPSDVSVDGPWGERINMLLWNMNWHIS